MDEFRTDRFRGIGSCGVGCDGCLRITRGLEMVRRTQLISGNSPVLLLDTIGELAALFQYATVVFIGGSLVPTGGHNVLEPARQSKPIVFGPHMENFRDMVRLFLETNAA